MGFVMDAAPPLYVHLFNCLLGQQLITSLSGLW